MPAISSNAIYCIPCTLCKTDGFHKHHRDVKSNDKDVSKAILQAISFFLLNHSLHDMAIWPITIAMVYVTQKAAKLLDKKNQELSNMLAQYARLVSFDSKLGGNLKIEMVL